MDFLRHLFVPRHTNNFRARILHHSQLSILIFAILLFSILTFVVKKTNPEILGISYSITEEELLNYTNNARIQNGGNVLQLSGELSDAARRKAQNMFEKNYWAHFAPDGTSPWSFIKSSGYEYSYAGENLAKGFVSSQDVVNAWMGSPSHKENLLSSKYKDLGFAVAEGNLEGEETVLVIQMFGAPTGFVASETAPPQQVSVNKNSVDTSQKVSAEYSTQNNPMINSYSFTKGISIAFLIFVIVVLLLDLVIVERKKIPRIVGHNLDHIILITLFLIFILIESSRGIL